MSPCLGASSCCLVIRFVTLTVLFSALFPAASRLKRDSANVTESMFHTSVEDVRLLFEVVTIWIYIFTLMGYCEVTLTLFFLACSPFQPQDPPVWCAIQGQWGVLCARCWARIAAQDQEFESHLWRNCSQEAHRHITSHLWAVQSEQTHGAGGLWVHPDDAGVHQPAGSQHHLQMATASVGGVFC